VAPHVVGAWGRPDASPGEPAPPEVPVAPQVVGAWGRPDASPGEPGLVIHRAVADSA